MHHFVKVASASGAGDQRRAGLCSDKPRRPGIGPFYEGFWLIAALGLTLLFASRTMAPAIKAGNVVQDDARQQVFWMYRFLDPELFQNDLMADYFETMTPPGYAAVYRALSLAVDPLRANKLLPPVIGLASGLFIFLLVRRLHPAPEAAFLGSVLATWFFWQHNAPASATPRAFLLPLLAAVLWALVSRRLVLTVVLVVLSALFYPVAAALGVVLLGVRLVRFTRWRPALVREPGPWVSFLAAAGLVAVVLMPTQLGSARFGRIISAAQASTMPEFHSGGRQAYFTGNFYRYWIASDRSGLDLTVSDPQTKLPILFEYAALAAVLPALLLFGPRLPALKRLSDQSVVLFQLLIASFTLFFLAHLLLFRLFYPARYVKWSLPLVFAVAAGLALVILAESIARGFSRPWRHLIVGAVTLGLALAVAAYPARYKGGFRGDRHPAVTDYLLSQPKDLLVAGVPAETDLVPVFARRPVLVNQEYALSFHPLYYQEIRGRMEDLIDAYYSESPERIIEFADRYGVGVFLVNRAAFDPSISLRTWTDLPGVRWEPFTSAVQARLGSSRRFALLDLADRCGVLREGTVEVVPTDCLRQHLKGQQ